MGHYWEQTKETAREFIPEFQERTIPRVKEGAARAIVALSRAVESLQERRAVAKASEHRSLKLVIDNFKPTSEPNQQVPPMSLAVDNTKLLLHHPTFYNRDDLDVPNHGEAMHHRIHTGFGHLRIVDPLVELVPDEATTTGQYPQQSSSQGGVHND